MFILFYMFSAKETQDVRKAAIQTGAFRSYSRSGSASSSLDSPAYRFCPEPYKNKKTLLESIVS